MSTSGCLAQEVDLITHRDAMSAGICQRLNNALAIHPLAHTMEEGLCKNVKGISKGVAQFKEDIDSYDNKSSLSQCSQFFLVSSSLSQISNETIAVKRNKMIFITQTNTGTMVKRVPQEQMIVIEAKLLENHFLPSSGFVMLMSVEDVLICQFL